MTSDTKKLSQWLANYIDPDKMSSHDYSVFCAIIEALESIEKLTAAGEAMYSALDEAEELSLDARIKWENAQ